MVNFFETVTKVFQMYPTYNMLAAYVPLREAPIPSIDWFSELVFSPLTKQRTPLRGSPMLYTHRLVQSLTSDAAITDLFLTRFGTSIMSWAR